MKGIYKQKGVGTRKFYQAKNWAGYCKITLFYQGPIKQITKLVLIGKFLVDWIEIPVMEKPKL